MQLEERRLIDSFVNSVTILDDYVLITFNYKGDSKRGTFDEIKRSNLKSVGGPKPPVFRRKTGGFDISS